jgi:CDP-diacylglycerol--inositol 3-phosphatidyltransferase
MSPRTRRQAAKASNASSSDSEAEVKSNGNGIAHRADVSDDAPRENIFLFYPNIIGMISSTTPRIVSELLTNIA